MAQKRNKLGDRRGMSDGSKAGLEKARRVRRDKPNHGKRIVVTAPPPREPHIPRAPSPPIQTPKLSAGSVERLNERVRDYVKLSEDEPNALASMMVASLFADLDAANTFLKKSWAWINTFMQDGGDPREIVKLIEQLRKWTDQFTNATLKVAELQTKVVAHQPDDPMDRYRIKDGDSSPVEVERVKVMVVENARSPKGGNGSTPSTNNGADGTN